MSEIFIIWGSQSGNAKNLAHLIGDSLTGEYLVHVLDMGLVDPEQLKEINTLLVVTSTYGDGEPPDNASEWMSFLKFEDQLNLTHLRYAVIGLGDTYYPHFCQAGKDFDLFLEKHGAQSMLRRLDCDLYYEEQYPDWLVELKSVLKNYLMG
jgi:sulfite reductase (NADPH) flavoprotein alpha-component